MSPAYRVRQEHEFTDGTVVRVGDLYRDAGRGPIRDTYRVKSIRQYRNPRSLEVVLTIIRRERDGEVTEPNIDTQMPIGGLFYADQIVPTQEGQADA